MTNEQTLRTERSRRNLRGLSSGVWRWFVMDDAVDLEGGEEADDGIAQRAGEERANGFVGFRIEAGKGWRDGFDVQVPRRDVLDGCTELHGAEALEDAEDCEVGLVGLQFGLCGEGVAGRRPLSEEHGIEAQPVDELLGGPRGFAGRLDARCPSLQGLAEARGIVCGGRRTVRFDADDEDDEAEQTGGYACRWDPVERGRLGFGDRERRGRWRRRRRYWSG